MGTYRIAAACILAAAGAALQGCISTPEEVAAREAARRAEIEAMMEEGLCEEVRVTGSRTQTYIQCAPVPAGDTGEAQGAREAVRRIQTHGSLAICDGEC